MKTESEWDRVKGNPDNVIVSDSLRGLLDLDSKDDKDYTKTRSIEFDVILFFEAPVNGFSMLETSRVNLGLDDIEVYEVQGHLISFERSVEEICYTIEMKATDAESILSGHNFSAVRISHDDATLHSIEMVDGDSPPKMKLDFNNRQLTSSTHVILSMSIALTT